MLWSGMSLVLAIALGVGALAGLIFMCIFEKSYLILATASAGASAATPLIAILIGHIPAAWATAILADARFKYAKAITQLVLFIIGLIVQCRLTRKRCAYGDKSEYETAPFYSPPLPLLTLPSPLFHTRSKPKTQKVRDSRREMLLAP